MMSSAQSRMSRVELNSLLLSPGGTPKRPPLAIEKMRKRFSGTQSVLSGTSIKEENEGLPLRPTKSLKNSSCLEEKTNDDRRLYTTAPTSPTPSNIDEKSQSATKISTMPPPPHPPSPLLAVKKNGSVLMNHANNQEKN